MYCFMTYSWCHTGKIKCTRQIVNLTYLQNIIPEKTFKYCTVSRRCRKVAVILQKVNYMTLVQSKIFLHINTYCWTGYRYVTVLYIFLFMETLLWHDLRCTHNILFFQISVVKKFWLAARIKKKTNHWKYKSSVKNLNPIRKTEWNLLLSQQILI